MGSALGAGIGVELADDLEAALALDADGDGVVATVVADRHFFVVVEHCRDLQSEDLVHLCREGVWYGFEEQMNSCAR